MISQGEPRLLASPELGGSRKCQQHIFVWRFGENNSSVIMKYLLYLVYCNMFML